MKTNIRLIKDLDTWTPERKGVVTMPEIYHINKTLCLDEMDVLQLRNLRDMVVMYYTIREKYMNIDTMDKTSAITAVIDNKIFNLGAEV